MYAYLLTMFALPLAKRPLMCACTTIAASIRLFVASFLASSSLAFLRGCQKWDSRQDKRELVRWVGDSQQ